MKASVFATIAPATLPAFAVPAATVSCTTVAHVSVSGHFADFDRKRLGDSDRLQDPSLLSGASGSEAFIDMSGEGPFCDLDPITGLPRAQSASASLCWDLTTGTFRVETFACSTSDAHASSSMAAVRTSERVTVQNDGALFANMGPAAPMRRRAPPTISNTRSI
ncbi:hypothetical protein [Rhodovulum kholense]|uniref:Uncharacterized protein n=1 Tax=Rhodovulum kholense TaxID=453584 RepID=A0A8E2VJJ3_9RHOB|nr:hypothetical protein [Rhodovulum kholense]PTW48277.1 hypothetical protein C8N38_10826 [Rhodovulum kholense]